MKTSTTSIKQSKNRNPASGPIVRCSWASPLGPMTLAATSQGLAGAWFNGQKHMPATEAWPEQSDHPVLLQAQVQLGEYFAGERHLFDVPLDPLGGTVFQQQVWQALLAIPAGSTTSYGALAQRIGRPAAVRAVGAAVGRNPLTILVPCHRVVGADGSLTGYAGGLERKTALLQREQAPAATISA
ncbi:cysteine methyltransferase [Rhodoferax lacus]|uniref:Methylated-DNA--protein-cysteine methyltransferase n=1 Tax=Rhodoferax lacus TaxID=2184758 RepID=A0A3E1RFL5_9BURK|nr:methylated-DNA--[protein]-cysteine S-methyltransferase [Rhodoferax lacus]RFO98159.1 cysteine methyltransferase [Rhodoferax lacus]